MGAKRVTTWVHVHTLATALSERGDLVTQLHFMGDVGPDSWAYGDAGAHVILNAATDKVVTTDGTEYPVGVAE